MIAAIVAVLSAELVHSSTGVRTPDAGPVRVLDTVACTSTDASPASISD
jgi:hypothetical protein